MGAVEVDGVATTGVETSPETSLDAGALALGVTVTMTVWPSGAVLVDGVGTALAVSPDTDGPEGAAELGSVTVSVTGQTVVVSGTTEVTTAVEPAVETVTRFVVKIVLVVNEVGVAAGVLASPSTPEEVDGSGVDGVDSALTGIRVVISVVDAGTRVVWTAVELAGQLVTVGAQEVTVMSCVA